jgi:hypothetical protein
MVSTELLDKRTIFRALRSPLPVVEVDDVKQRRSFTEYAIAVTRVPDLPHHQVEESHRIASTAHAEKVQNARRRWVRRRFMGSPVILRLTTSRYDGCILYLA